MKEFRIQQPICLYQASRPHKMIPANIKQNHARRRVCLVLALLGLMSAVSLVTGPIRPASAQAFWSYTGSLNKDGGYHTATRLHDGKVLVFRAFPDASAELYDPSTGTWSVTGSLNLIRVGYTATLLGNGKVLVAGGSASNAITNTAELYDPATGEWSFTGNLNDFRTDHTATLLSNGKVLFAGGVFGPATDTAELYDPLTETWSLTDNLSENRVCHSATRLQDGKVLVAGGCESEDCFRILGSAEIYDPNTETWSGTDSLNRPRRCLTLTTLTNGNVLLTGGSGQFLPEETAELYSPATGRWSHTGGPPLNVQSGVMLLSSGQVLALQVLELSSSAQLYNPATGKWNTTANPNTRAGVTTATPLSDGKVLVTIGQSAELYHPEMLDPVPTAPRIIMASVSGKKLVITGENFHGEAVVLLNGEEQKSKNDLENPQTVLIGKKAGKKIKAGDRLQVRNPDGTLSAEFTFTGS